MGDHDPEIPETDAFSGDPARFTAWLGSRGLDYLRVEEDSPDRVRLRFTGRFEDRDVVWDCELLTLAAEARRLARSGAAVPPAGLRRFIDIGEDTGQGIPLRVGLELAVIDRPAIEKTIVMIRNYRRLRRGRHEYGELHSLS